MPSLTNSVARIIVLCLDINSKMKKKIVKANVKYTTNTINKFDNNYKLTKIINLNT